MAYKKLKQWFDKDLARLLSEKIKPHYELFDIERFIEKIDKGTKDL